MLDPAVILFDCMETIVDVIEKPEVRLYAHWAFHGCGYERLWDSFDAFVSDYVLAKDTLAKQQEKYQEHNLLDRYRIMASQRVSYPEEIAVVSESILHNYWNHYKQNCYVDNIVKSTLAELSSRIPCGVVSNFMVDGGIEELLAIHGVSQYFDFVVTSVRTGWKKPHPAIYAAASEFISVHKDRVLFVGDDFECDYEGPTRFGFQSCLLDKENRYPNIVQRIRSIDDLLQRI